MSLIQRQLALKEQVVALIFFRNKKIIQFFSADKLYLGIFLEKFFSILSGLSCMDEISARLVMPAGFYELLDVLFFYVVRVSFCLHKIFLSVLPYLSVNAAVVGITPVSFYSEPVFLESQKNQLLEDERIYFPQIGNKPAGPAVLNFVDIPINLFCSPDCAYMPCLYKSCRSVYENEKY
nr:hypothetical protein [Treponema sp. UBA753]